MITYATEKRKSRNKNRREEDHMKRSAEEIRKEILSSDTEEVAKILETLDKNSIILARTYMTALADRQELEKAKLAAAAV